MTTGSRYLVFKTDTGEVVQRCFSSEPGAHLTHDLQPLEAAIQYDEAVHGASPETTHYIQNPQTSPVIAEKTAGVATADKTAITADAVDTATISGVHNPTEVWINDQRKSPDVTDGTLAFTSNIAGDFTIRLVSAPYLDQTFIVTAA